MDASSLMRGDAFVHFVSGSRRVNIRLGVLLLIPKSPQAHIRPAAPKMPWAPVVIPQKGVPHALGDKLSSAEAGESLRGRPLRPKKCQS